MQFAPKQSTVPICRKATIKKLVHTNAHKHCQSQKKKSQDNVSYHCQVVNLSRKQRQRSPTVQACPSKFRDLHSHFGKWMCWRLSLRCQVWFKSCSRMKRSLFSRPMTGCYGSDTQETGQPSKTQTQNREEKKNLLSSAGNVQGNAIPPHLDRQKKTPHGKLHIRTRQP